MTRRLAAVVACRNSGSRLYGKPLQNLDVENAIAILDNVVGCLRTLPEIDDIVLAVSEGSENQIFLEFAAANDLQSVIGDEVDVLGRLIAGADACGATDIFRITSESPFLYFEPVAATWDQYVAEGLDAVFLDDIVDGCGFEILSVDALRQSHVRGEDRHRSELCSLYIRENNADFKVLQLDGPPELNRMDLRLTVDNPEDLVVCRHVYSAFKDLAPRIPVTDIVRFLDQNARLIELTAPFTEAGYASMFVWGKDDK